MEGCQKKNKAKKKVVCGYVHGTFVTCNKGFKKDHGLPFENLKDNIAALGLRDAAEKVEYDKAELAGDDGALKVCKRAEDRIGKLQKVQDGLCVKNTDAGSPCQTIGR